MHDQSDRDESESTRVDDSTSDCMPVSLNVDVDVMVMHDSSDAQLWIRLQHTYPPLKFRF